MKKLSSRERQLEYWKALQQKQAEQPKKKQINEPIFSNAPLKDLTNTPKGKSKIKDINKEEDKKQRTEESKEQPSEEITNLTAQMTNQSDDIPSKSIPADVHLDEMKQFIQEKIKQLKHFKENIEKGELVEVFLEDSANLLNDLMADVEAKFENIKESIKETIEKAEKVEELEIALSITMAENEKLYNAVLELSQTE